MSSQTSGPLTRAAAAGCAKAWSLTVMTALAVTPAARCDPDARMRGEEDSRCFQFSRIALDLSSSCLPPKRRIRRIVGAVADDGRPMALAEHEDLDFRSRRAELGPHHRQRQ